MQRHHSNRSNSLIILKCLYGLMSFLSVSTFSESAISFLSPTFNKTSNVQLWLTATQVSIATISLLIMALPIVAFLIAPLRNRAKVKRWELISFAILIVGCVVLTYLTDTSGSLRQMTSFDLSISSSICFMISTLVLMAGMLSVEKSSVKDKSQVPFEKIILFIVCFAQIVGTSGFLIQSWAGNNHPIWNDIAFFCFIIGVASALVLFKKDAKCFYNLIVPLKQSLPPMIEMTSKTPPDAKGFYNYSVFAQNQSSDDSTNSDISSPMIEMAAR